jgi:hypothetical protein
MFAELLQKIRQTLGKVQATRIEILPPWQGSRAKPDPKRPHHRRVVEVLEAMASAPPGSSFRKLIEHIRRRTGAGASPKLIGRLRLRNHEARHQFMLIGYRLGEGSTEQLLQFWQQEDALRSEAATARALLDQGLLKLLVLLQSQS